MEGKCFPFSLLLSYIFFINMFVIIRHDGVESTGLMIFLIQPSSFLKASFLFLDFFFHWSKQFFIIRVSSPTGINLLVKSKAFQYAMCKQNVWKCSKLKHWLQTCWSLIGFADVVVAINGVWILVETYTLNSKISETKESHYSGRISYLLLLL